MNIMGRSIDEPLCLIYFINFNNSFDIPFSSDTSPVQRTLNLWKQHLYMMHEICKMIINKTTTSPWISDQTIVQRVEEIQVTHILFYICIWNSKNR